jgi:2'-5' RNA ligase
MPTAAPRPPAPRPPAQPRQPDIVQAAPAPSLLERARESVANSVIGSSLESAVPGLAKTLHLEPTLTPGTDEYRQTTTSMPALPAWATTPIGGDYAETPQAQAQTARTQKEFAAQHPKIESVLEKGDNPYILKPLQGVSEVTHGLTTPANLALVMGTPELKPLTALFAAQAAQGTYQTADQAYQAFRAGKNPEGMKLATEAGLYGVMTALAGRSALEGAFPVDTARPTVTPATPTPEGSEFAQRQLPAPPRPAEPQYVGEPATPPQPANVANAEVENVPRGTSADRPVVQASTDPAEIRTSAEAQKAPLEQNVQAAISSVPGAQVEGARVKTADSVENKEDRGKPPETNIDHLGVRVSVPTQADVPAVRQAIESQLPVVSKEKITSNGVNADQYGIQTGAPGEPNQVSELQVVTKPVAEAMKATDDLYAEQKKALAAGDQAKADELGKQIKAKMEAAQLESTEPKYKFASTQHNISPASDAGRALDAARAGVADADLDGQGKDVDGNHVTVRYGLKGELTPKMRAFIESQQPFDAALGPLASFPPSEHSDGAAPLIAPVESPELTRLNNEISQHGEFTEPSFSEYKPHATVAYVKPGAVQKYVGNKSTEGKTFRVDSIAVTDRNGNATEIPLRGAQEPENQNRAVLQESPEQTMLGNPRPQETLNAVQEPSAAGVLPREQGQAPEAGSERLGVGRIQQGTQAPGPQATQGAEAAPPVIRPAVGGHDGRATDVLTPTRKLPGTYRLVEAADLMPSHHPASFEPNPEYPAGVQERDYKNSKEAQNRVITQAQNYDPAYTVNTNPDAVNGPPVITPDGTVLGGNSRAMSTQRIYAEGSGAAYRDAIKRDAATYGLTPEQVDGMNQPVLVRQIDRPASLDEAKRIGSELNKSMTGALGVSEKAVSAGQKLKPETLQAVSAMQNEDDSSLREVLSRKGPEILQMMVQDGALTERERPQYLESDGKSLSEEGKTFIERAMMGSVFDDSHLLDAAPKSIKDKIEKSLGSISAIGSRPDEWNLVPALRPALLRAVAEHTSIAQRGSTVDLTVNQQSMFGPGRNPVVDALVRVLDEKPNAVRARFTQFATDAKQNLPGETRMFGGGEAFDAFNHAFGSKLTDEEFHNGIKEILRTETPAAPVQPQSAPARNESLPERPAGEPARGGGEGNGLAAGTPRPPAEPAAAGAAGRNAGIEAGRRPELKAPRPPQAAPSIFKEGRQSTPVLVRDADNNWVHATLDYFNGGVNGAARRGRVTLASGLKMDDVPESALKAAPALEKPKIPSVSGTPQEKQVIAYTESHLPELMDEYRVRNTSQGVLTIATDAAKELYPSFQRDPVRGERDVHSSAKAVADAALKAELATPILPDRRNVEIVTASPGSGKTWNQSGALPDGIGLRIEDIVAKLDDAAALIDKLLAAGREPRINWIHVDDPAKTVRRMALRAVGHDGQKGIGRTVPLSYMADAYSSVPRVLLEMMDKYGDRIGVSGTENSGARDAAYPIKNVRQTLQDALQWNHEKTLERMRTELETLKQEGIFQGERGKAIYDIAAYSPEEKSGSEIAPPESAGRSAEDGGANDRIGQRAGEAGYERSSQVLAASKNREVGEGGGIQPGAAADVLAVEQKESETRAARRTETLPAANAHNLAENAAQHKTSVVDVAGHKAVLLDPDGEGVWHRLFRKVKGDAGENPLGAGSSWTGMSLDRRGVNTALDLLKKAGEGEVTSVKAGFDRMARALREAQTSTGGATVLRGDYRADTAREEATHHWQREHALDRSYAMGSVADQQEFQDVVSLLKDQGYRNAKPRTIAMELMAKALAGDAEFKISDDQRESLVRSFLTEAIDEKGIGILDNLPEVDPRVRPIVEDVRREYEARNEDGGAQAPGIKGGPAGREGRAGAGGPLSREPSGEVRPSAGRGERSVPKVSAEESELGAFQRKAPRPPVRSAALPGMEGDIEAQRTAAGEEQGRQLTDRLLAPRPSISRAAGEMERESPLFRDTEAGGQGSLFQRAKDDPETKTQNPWFLKSANVIEQKMRGPMPGDALIHMLKNNGVKPDEIKWSGLEDLRGKPRITPDEVKEHLAANAIQIKEVTHKELSEPIENIIARGEELTERPTRYGSYTLPGGENYREMLLTLPGAEIKAPEKLTELPAGYEVGHDSSQPPDRKYHILPPNQVHARPFEGRHPTIEDATEAALLRLNGDAYRTAREAANKTNFTSGHWDEPNILGHVRFNDRTGPNGEKLLHVEELQSDWHQKGRTKGYATPLTSEEEAEFKELLSKGTMGRDRAEEDQFSQLVDRKNPGSGATVPDAPFKKTWPELLFKRMVRYAAENGYDGISWTPGEQQAERYDLSKQVDRLHVLESHFEGFPGDGLGYQVTANKDGRVVIDKRVQPKELPDLIGKEMAQRALEQIEENKKRPVPKYAAEMKGLDLKVGGEGMKGFYDKIVPDLANKIGKPFGSKVEETTIDVPPALGKEPFHYQGPERTIAEVREYISDGSHSAQLERQASDVYELMGRGIPFSEAIQKEGSPALAYDFGGKMDITKPTTAQPVPYLPVTDAMRGTVLREGQPLFQKPGETNPTSNTGQLWGRKNTRAQQQLAFGGPSTWQRALGGFRDWRDDNPDAGDDLRALVRERRGEMDRNVLQLKKSLEDTRKDFVTMPREDVTKFIDDVEHGRFRAIDPKYRDIAQGLHEIFVSDREELQRLDPEKLKNFYENYFPHIWDHSGKVARMMQAQSGTKPLFGSGSFLQHRTLYPPTFKEGIELGLEPKTWNPVDMALLKHAEIQRYIFGLKTVQDMKAIGLTRVFKKAADAPPNWVQLDDRFATVTRRNEAGEMVLEGHYYAPEPAAKSFNNFVSKGLAGRNGILDSVFTLNRSMNAVQLGLSAFHATASTINLGIGDIALGLEELSQGRPVSAAAHIARGAVPGASLARHLLVGNKVMREYLEPGSAAKYEAEANWVARAGGRPEQSVNLEPARWRQVTEDIRRGDYFKGTKGAIPGIIDLAGSWLMHGMIPRIKLGSFQDMAANILKEADHNNWSEEEIRSRMQSAWDSVDNRYGQMVYDNRFWNRVALEIAQLGIRSVGWQGGTYKEYGGGVTDAAKAFARAASRKKPEVTHKLAFSLATPIYTALIAAVGTYLMTGHKPDTDKYGLKAYSMIETADGTMLSIPGYSKNLMSVGEDVAQNGIPWRTAVNTASPAISTSLEMMQNKDYYGNEIRNEDDLYISKTLGKSQAGEYGKFIASQYIPFTVKSFQQQRQRAGEGEFSDISEEKSGGMSLLSYAGFQPATRVMQNSSAMNLAEHYRDETPQAPRTAEQAEHNRTFRNLVKALENGNLNQNKLNEAMEKGRITSRQYSEAVREAHWTPLERVTSRLSFTQAMQVWQKANPQEKASLRDLMAEKSQHQLETVYEQEGDQAAQELQARLKQQGILTD